MKKFIAICLTLATLFTALPASAQDLDVVGAKQRGLVGEMPDGMLGIVTKVPTPQLETLVEKTNADRLMIYKDMAEKQRIDIAQIKIMAGEKIYRLAKKGDYLMYMNEWTRKP